MMKYFDVLLFVISLLLIAAGITEAVLAQFFPVSYLKPPEKHGKDAWSELWHRPAEIPGLIYEIVPNKGQYKSARYNREINSLGMRDSEPAMLGGRSSCRVIVVGDSIAYGLGVESDEAFPGVLESQASRVGQLKQIEVFNMSVAGYSSGLSEASDILECIHYTFPVVPVFHVQVCEIIAISQTVY